MMTFLTGIIVLCVVVFFVVFLRMLFACIGSGKDNSRLDTLEAAIQGVDAFDILKTSNAK